MIKASALLILLLPAQLLAQISHNRKLQESKFNPSSGCGLKSFSVSTFDGGWLNFGGREGVDRFKMMAAMWETTDPECAKDYGVVQFIRGCVYNIDLNQETGEADRYFGIKRKSRGESILFQHKSWEVDSLDIDPLYSSYDLEDANESNRFNWNKVPKKQLNIKNTPASLAAAHDVFNNNKNYDYVQNVQRANQIFVTDIPNGSSYTPKNAFGKDWIVKSSLEFKTCLYQTKDIPTSGDPKSFTVSATDGGPIVCYDWSDKIDIDYKNKSLKRTEILDPFCLE